ncbi:MAG: non-heme iron oxygenase ferredoxin subunit [Chloroflexota bacterium]|nr:non-heme iron oxygenase ferredoxin subunit [Chloroflexota bacterium]
MAVKSSPYEPFSSPESRVSTPDNFELVARVEDVTEGTLLGVEKADGERICLINHNGEIHAVSNNCTHQDFPMSEGYLVPSAGGCIIECTWHGAAFDCVTGAVKKQPAVEPLPVYHVRVTDGNIFVGGRKT